MIVDGPTGDLFQASNVTANVIARLIASELEDSPLNGFSDINHRHRFYPRVLTGRVEGDDLLSSAYYHRFRDAERPTNAWSINRPEARRITRRIAED